LVDTQSGLHLALKGKILLVEYRGESRAVTFYYSDPSRTAALLVRELEKMGADPKTISYAEAQLAEIYLQQVLPLQNGARSRATSLVDGLKLVEEGYDPLTDKVYFIVYDCESGSLEKRETYWYQGVEVKPIFNSFVRNGLILLPTDAEEYGSEQSLFSEVKEFLNRWHEEPREYERAFDVAYVLTTYIYDLLPEIAYRRWLAPFGRGKTTALETVGSVCYRPMLLAGCDTKASLRRCFDLYRGTALIDEADFSDSSIYSDIIKILNVGWSNLLGWYVCQDPLDPNATVLFRVFGPKLLATRERFKDLGLESKILTVKGLQNRRDMPLFRFKRFLSEAQEIRNKLLMFRFRNYRKVVLLVEKLESPALFSEIYPGESELTSRIKQLITPLALLFPDLKDVLMEAAKDFEDTLAALDEDKMREEELKRAIAELLRDLIAECEKSLKSRLFSESERGERCESSKEGVLAALRNVHVNYGGGVARVDGGFRLPLKELTVRAANIDTTSPSASRETRVWAAHYSKVAHDRLDLKVVVGSHGYREILVPFKRANEFLETNERRRWLEEI
jgi:hypothetical protein